MSNSAGRSPDDDESSTRSFWPFAGSGGDADAGTEAGRSPDADTDATQVHRPPDTSRRARQWDATEVNRETGGAAQHLPASKDATRAQGPAAERWTARAGVPQPGEVRRSAPQEQEWVGEEEDPYQGRSWFSPVIVGFVALVLIAALAMGLYLIYRATVNGQNAPGGVVDSTPATHTASAAPAPASAPPETTAAPTSKAPAPTSAAPPAARVVIPPLRGDTLAEATVKLQVLGLNVDIERRPDSSLPPGEVLSSRPGQGEAVAPGDTVTLIVAAPAAPPPSVPEPHGSASG